MAADLRIESPSNPLSDYDLQSETWRKLVTFLLKRKQQALLDNARDLSMRKTYLLRARVAEINALLALDPSIERLHGEL